MQTYIPRIPLTMVVRKPLRLYTHRPSCPPLPPRRLDISDNPIGNAGAEALANHALGADSCRLHELRMERCGVRAGGRLSLLSCVQANAGCPLRHLHLVGNRDPEADPAAGATLVLREPAGGRGGRRVVAIADISKAEQLMAQALNIGRQLHSKRHLHIYE